MAETSVLSGLDLTKWRREFIREYVRDTGFEPYMGDSPMDIIHVVNDLKGDGYTIRIPLIARLQGNGVTGNTRLSGSEERLDQYYQDISWEFYRNAIEVSKKEREKSAVDLLSVRRPLLKEWASELVKYQLIGAMHKMADGTEYASASAGTRNTWVTNNADRVLFGATKSNYSTTMATALANVDATNDKLTSAMGRLAKRMARTANPHIRPFKTGTQGREYYVMFCHPYCFRDLKSDATIIANNQYARAREGDAMEKNPLFQDGDLIDDGIIYREIPEFLQARQGSTSDSLVNTNMTLIDAGNGATVDVGVNILCGAQAIGMVNKQAATPITKKEDDYGFFDGVGIELAHGMDKLRWNNGAGTNKDLGMLTVYAAAQPDA
jgi:N4-gp56 family major capsid protein